ncbi:peptidoglycan-binding protein, partial [Mesorhizobium sp. M7A.F.Ca.CA.004.05.1.1]
SSANTTAVSGLAQDLKTLETLTRRSDERNSRTFEAIHDTLLKIVDRLGSLEPGEPVEAMSELLDAAPVEPSNWRGVRRPKMAVDAPSMDIDQPLPLTGDLADLDGRAAAILRNEPGARSDLGGLGMGTRTPAEAAAAAAMAALGSDTIVEKNEQAGGRRSMFGGLARA